AAFSEGIARVLEEAGCFLVGGDTSVSEAWRYGGFAMGPVASPRPLTRILPEAAQSLWLTGCIGAANLAAFRRLPPPRFEFRLKEARALRACAAGCMDTSGGLLDALWTLQALNPRLRLTVDAESVPLAPGLREYAAGSGIPAGAAWVG